MLDYGVTTAILNTIDIFRSLCKLNFGPSQCHVKSCHFPQRRDARRQYFYFLHKFLGKVVTKRLEERFWIMIWVYHYFLIGIRLDLDLDNSCWIRITPKVCYKQH